MSQPRAIISPSVLASDFGKLSSEVERMMNNGAEWVHMGEQLHNSASYSQ
jgi:ribulose-phosphate 3-epimerase